MAHLGTYPRDLLLGHFSRVHQAAQVCVEQAAPHDGARHAQAAHAAGHGR